MSSKKILSSLFTIVLIFVLQIGFAQNRTVTGKVSDSKDGSPVVGASVQTVGARGGTSTKADGTFSLSVSLLLFHFSPPRCLSSPIVFSLVFLN